MQHMEYLSNACSSCTWSFGRLLLPKIHLCYTNNIPGFGITICATWALSFVSTCWRTHLEVRYHSAGPWSLRIWTNYETNHVVIDNHSKLEHRPPNMIKNKNTSQLEAIWKTSTKSVNIDKRLRIHQMKLCTNVKIRQLIFSSTNNNSNTAAVLVPAQPAVKKTINNLISRFPSNVEFLCSFFPLCFFSYFLHLQASLDWCSKGTKTSFMVLFMFLPWSYCSWTMCICNGGFRWLVEPAPPHAPVAPGATIALTMLSVLQKVNEHLCFNRLSAVLAPFVS